MSERLSKTSKGKKVVKKSDRKVSPGFIDGMVRFGVDERVVDAAKKRNKMIAAKRAV